MSHFAAYLRASPGNRQDLSVERQRLLIMNWASENGHTIGRVFVDDARSGSTTVGRTGFLEMVAYLAGNTPETGLVLWEYTRMARSYDDAQYFLATIRRNNYEVITLSEQIPVGAIGRLMESIHLWAAQDERSRMQERVRSGLMYLVHHHRCWPNGHAAPVGYQYEAVAIGARRDGTPHMGRRLIIDPVWGPLVLKAFQMRAAGYSLSEVHNATRLAKRRTSYTGILGNRLYLGEFTYGKQTTKDFCPALVDQDLFDHVQEIEARWRARAQVYQARRSASTYLLSGLLICGQCGALMSGLNSGTTLYYYCSNRYTPPIDQPVCKAPGIEQERIEQKVIERLLDIIENGHVEKLVERYNQNILSIDNQWADDLSKATKDLHANTKAQERIAGAIAESGHSRALLNELERLEKAQTVLVQKVAELEQARPAPVVIPDLVQLAATLRLAIKSSDRRHLQLLIRQTVIYVQATKEKRRHGDITGELRWSIGTIGEIAL